MIIILIFLFYQNLYSFIFNEAHSGYYLEDIFSLPLQVKYQGLGYVNNSLLEINSLSVLNPAVVFEPFYKELNFVYHPLVLGSDFYGLNFTTVFNTDKVYLPICISVLNITTGFSERMNIFKENYGYEFNENIVYTNVAATYYLRKFNINLGMNLKNFFHNIDDYYNYGTNIDFGIVYPTKDTNFLWGISWLNIIPVKYGQDFLPSIIRTSLNQKVGRIFFSDIKIYTELDVFDIYNFEHTSFRWGIGTSYDFFYLPISVCFSLNYYGVGMGIDIEKDNFNFSYGLNFNDIGTQHRFAVSYKFNFYPKEVKSIVEQELDKLKNYKQQMLTEYKRQNKELAQLKKQYEIEQKISVNILKAKDYLMNKNYKEAKKLLEQNLSLDPNNAESKELLYLVNSYITGEIIKSLYAEAIQFYEKGNYNQAIEKLNKLLELQPDNKKAFVLLKFANAQKFVLEKKYKEAKTELFEIIKIDPENETALELLKKVDTLIEISE